VRLLPVKEDFEFRSPRSDIIAGLTVAVVALPLALAFGIASGLGAAAGITTAVIAGFLAALFGGSRVQVSGPTGAMTVVLIPIFHSFGANGVLLVGFLAGAVLLLFAIFRLGSHIHRIPTAVVEGFTAGIAVVIALQQVPFILGLPPTGEDKAWLQAVHLISGAKPNWTAIITAGVVCLSILAVARFVPKLPFALIAIVVVTVVAEVSNLPVDRIGTLPTSLGRLDCAFLQQSNWWQLIPSAIAVAALAALEALLSAKISDKLTGFSHDSNREVFGQSVANLVVPFFGGVPATAALARTAVNVRAHAHSRLAAMIHSIALAVAVLVAASLVGRIPLAALAGVLLATTIQMVNFKELRALASGHKLDAAVLLTTFLATVFIDLITAVIIGVLLSVLFRKTKLLSTSSID
jgi:SulP family sulfate permease